VSVCVLGIVFAGLAGVSKDKELSPEQQKEDIPEFNLKLGLVVATFCGIMSACFAFGLAAGDPIKVLALEHGTSVMYQGLPVLIVVLTGGFVTNCVWCLILSARNRSFAEYLRIPAGREPGASLKRNYLLSAVAGFTWYLQFFFYSMGETQMGKSTASPAGPCTWRASSSSVRYGELRCMSGAAWAGGLRCWSFSRCWCWCLRQQLWVMGIC